MKKQNDKILPCLIQNVPRYKKTLVQKLASIIVIDRILSRPNEKCRRNLGTNA